MNSATEIRKLPPTNIRELVQILEQDECWKRLMSIIPKTLDKDHYECKITLDNLHKYNSEHFRILENVSVQRRRACAEILFDEWGTSGRVRPALGHLLYLLTKAELFRAADYVALKLLGVDLPPRPTEGPAALVNTTALINSTTSNESRPDPQLEEIERILDAIDYKSSAIANIINSSSNVSREPNNSPPVIPKIVVSEVPDGNTRIETAFNYPLVMENAWWPPVNQHQFQENHSDLMEFSDTDHSNEYVPSESQIPRFSRIMASVQDAEVDEYLPNLSILEPNANSDIIPAFSNLLGGDSDATEDENMNATISNYIPDVSLLKSDRELIPNLSALINADEDNVTLEAELPQLSILGITAKSSESNNFPVLSNPESSYRSLEFSQNSHSSPHSHKPPANHRPSCASPLPNLSLNTLLPHFTYHDIELATNNFDKTLHKNCRQIENSLIESNGRFLGSGAFGSVFLALGLTDKPVAVKKLFLDNVDVVNVDDTVTKQFRNEVEVLSRYKHDNLLSLIGYSCDGPTYCLLYEFIAGGALKERLQNEDDKLLWTDRLRIALGTAKAITYLHTAYSTPLIHRDIKTANILLDCQKTAKLGDFGLIKLTPNQSTNASTTIFGTSAYMAREAFRGDLSVKLDTFSFGVVLMELITGLPPLDENREGKDLVTHIEEVCEDQDISPLVDKRAGLWTCNDINFAKELFTIATKCIEENKKKRPYMVNITEELTNLIDKISNICD